MPLPGRRDNYFKSNSYLRSGIIVLKKNRSFVKFIREQHLTTINIVNFD